MSFIFRFTCVLALLTLLLHPRDGLSRETPLAAGDVFPPVEMPVPENPSDRIYLGLEGKTGLFSLTDVNGDVVLVEILNVYCPHCQAQTDPYNRLFQLISEDPETRGRIRMLGVAVANDQREVKIFRKKYEVPFPMIADPRFQVHQAVGGSATPFTIFVRQAPGGGPGIVADTHLGTDFDHEALFARLRRLMRADPETVRAGEWREKASPPEVEPILPPAALAARAKEGFQKLSGDLIDFERVSVPSGRKVYTALMQDGEQKRRYFAEVVSRPSICDVCHDVHFIYFFDASGEVLHFVPLKLAKYGNKNWSASDIDRMRERVVGRPLGESFLFDARVDAVSSATISSAMIFDSLYQGEFLLQELKRKGLF